MSSLPGPPPASSAQPPVAQQAQPHSSLEQPPPHSMMMSSRCRFVDGTLQGLAEAGHSHSTPTAIRIGWCGTKTVPAMSGRTTSTHSTAMMTNNWHGNWWSNWHSNWSWSNSNNRQWHGTDWRNAPRDAQPASTRTAMSEMRVGNPAPSWGKEFITHSTECHTMSTSGLRLCALSCTASHCPYNHGPCNKRLDDPETHRHTGHLFSHCKQDQRERRAAGSSY